MGIMYCDCNHYAIIKEIIVITIISTELNVVIGFLGSPYSVNESVGVLAVQVGVISGSLQRDVVLNLSTTDATAIGKQPMF